MAERARSARNAEHDAPPLRGIRAPQRAEHDVEGGAAHADADEDADREREAERGGRVRHEDEAERVQQASREEHASGAEAVGEHSGKGLRNAPQQVLQRHGETEHLAPPSVVHAHRLQKQAEAVADAERKSEDHARADEHDGGAGPAEIGHEGFRTEEKRYRISRREHRNGVWYHWKSGLHPDVTPSTVSITPLSRRLLPFLKWSPRVNAVTLKADALAGLIGAVVVLPKGVAFPTVAGLPPEYGLYCAMVPTVVAALFGSSLHTVAGPTKPVSLMVFAVLSPLATPMTPHYIELALTLALMSGIIMLAMGLLRFGSLVNFMSNSVVVGFTAALGVFIFASQLGNFLGIASAPAGFADRVRATFRRLGDAQLWVIAVATATLAIGALSRRVLTKIPPMLTAMVLGSLMAFLLNQALGVERTGLRTLGPLPGALPPLSFPDASAATLQNLLPGAIAVALVSLTQALSIAHAIALKSGQRIDNNQEFIAQGLANVAAAFFSGFPTSASANRCGINYDAGAKTPMSAIFSALLLVLLLLAVAPLVAYLPIAVVAGLLFLVAWNLIDFRRIRKILATSRGESAVLAVTFFATLLLDLEFAIFVAVFVSLVLYLNRTSHPFLRSIVPDPPHTGRTMTDVQH